MLAVGVEVTYNSTLKRVSQAIVQFTQHHMLIREILMHNILCSALHLKLYLYFFLISMAVDHCVFVVC